MSFLISVRNSCLSNNNLVFKNLKFLLRFSFILNRLIFRTLSCITTSDSLLNSKPSSRQPLRKETLSAKPERVLNSHLAILNLLLRLLLNIYWFSSGYMAIGIFRNLVVSISRKLWLPSGRFEQGSLRSEVANANR